MAIESENPQTILNEINDGITQIMNGTILEQVKIYLAASVYRHVYELYDIDEDNPNSYKRRKENGGLADKNKYYVLTDEGGSDEHTIQLADPRPEVGVVESGEGYEWYNSRIYRMQPFPRPYFSKVDEEIQTSMVFELIETLVLSL